MPIEIKQLEIRGKVVHGEIDNISVARDNVDLQQLQKRVVQECIEKLITYFEKKNER